MQTSQSWHAFSSFKPLLVATLMLATLAVGTAITTHPVYAATLGLEVIKRQDGGLVGPLNNIDDKVNGVNVCPTDPTNGCDFGALDDIVRTHDQISYRFNYNVNPPVDPNEDIIVTANLPDGAVWSFLPGSCKDPGSSISEDGRDLVCNLGTFNVPTTGSFDANVTVGGVANGTVIDFDATIDGTESAPVVSSPDATTVTAAPRYDIQKTQSSRTYLAKNGEPGFLIYYVLEFWTRDANSDFNPFLGTEALQPNISFVDDVSGVSPNVELHDCLNVNGDAPVWNVSSRPWGAIGINANATDENSVVDQGNISCSQPGGPGTNINIDLTGVDSTLDTHPTKTRSGGAISVANKYVGSYGVRLWVPAQDVIDNGGELPIENVFSGFDPVSITGQSNFGTATEDTSNNSATTTLISADGWWVKYYLDSLTQGGGVGTATGDRAGDGLIGPGETFATRVYQDNRGVLDLTSVEMCDVIDNRTYSMTGNNTITGGYVNAGKAYVFEYATGYVGSWPPDPFASPATALETECTDPTVTWVDASTFAGNIGDVTKFRIRLLEPMSPGQSIDLRTEHVVLANDPITGDPIVDGTELVNYATRHVDQFNDGNWRACGYQPKTYPEFAHTGTGCGDRVTLTRGIVRIDKEGSRDGINAGDSMTWTLMPTFTAPIEGINGPVTVYDVLPPELIYIAGSASLAPSQQASCIGAADPHPKCTAAGETVLAWDLGTRTANDVLPTITIGTLVDAGTPNGTNLTNTAIVQSPVDASSESDRTKTDTVFVQVPAVIAPFKTVQTPLILPNEPLQYTLSTINNTEQDLTGIDVIDVLPFVGDDAVGPFGAPDEYPDGRMQPSDYTGSYEFVSVSAPAGAAIYYTMDAPETIDRAPKHLIWGTANTNDLATGSTNWCPGIDTSNVDPAAVPTNGSGANCPATNADITAYRIVWAGPLLQDGGRVDFVLNLTTNGNARGDLYTNNFGMATDETPLPALSNEVSAQVVEPSVGDTIWFDLNSDGIQQSSEVGLENVTVTLSGFDKNGDAVNLIVTTDENGEYLFDNLLPSDTNGYTVTIDPSTNTTKPGVTFDETYDLDDGTGSFSTPLSSGAFVLYAADTRRDVDFGLTTPEPSISIEKTVYSGHNSGASCSSAGDLVFDVLNAPITYCFTITNTGNTFLENVTIADVTLGLTIGDLTYVAGADPMAPAAKLTYYYETTLAADLVNTASTTANPTDIDGNDLVGVDDVNDSDDAEVEHWVPAIQIEKTVYAGHDDGATCNGSELVNGPSGTAVTYCFEITNTGNTYLDTVTVNDDDLSITRADMTLLSGSEPLAPDATLVFYYETTITSSLVNTADTSGNPTLDDGTDIAGLTDPTDNDTAEVFMYVANIDIQKTVYAGHDSGASCTGAELVSGPDGYTVTYCFEITNTGNTYLNTITVTDDDLGISRTDMTLLSGTEPLAPDATLVFYYETTITEDLINTASTSGNPTISDGSDIAGMTDPTDNDTAEVAELTTGITIDKTVYAGHDSGASCQGSELVSKAIDIAITYCFVVTNNGNTHLDNVIVNDDDLGITRADMTVLSGTEPLAPDATLVFYYETTVAGDLVNTADTSGNPTTSDGTDLPQLPTDPTDEDTAEVVELVTDIALEKTVYYGHDTGASCNGLDELNVANGENITYCFEVTNNGNTHLDDVIVNDDDLGITRADMTLLSGTEPLAPDATLVFYYETTMAGDLLNTADTSGNPTLSDGTDVEGLDNPTAENTAEVLEYFTGITLDKTVYLGHDAGATCNGSELAGAAANATITYCFEVTNTGNTYLSDLSVSDGDLSISEADMTVLSGTLPLAPDATITYYYETTLVADLVNTATATGNPTEADGTDVPGLTDPSVDDTAEVVVLVPGIGLEKTVYAGHDAGVSCNGAELVSAPDGANVTYCFAVTNTSNTYLADVTLADADLSIARADMTLLSGTEPLAPDATLVFYYETTIDGDLLNAAQASGNPVYADGTDVENLDDPIDVNTAEVEAFIPSIDLQKTVYSGHNAGASCAGLDQITDVDGNPATYCFVVTNTSNHNYLDAVTLTDADLGITRADMTLLSGTEPLAPEASLVFFYEATIAGDLLNTANTSGNPTLSDGTDIDGLTDPTDSDTAEVVTWKPDVVLEKTVYIGHNAGTSCEGEELISAAINTDITYCFAVTNTGTTHLDQIAITDATLGITSAEMTLVSGTFPIAPESTAVYYYETALTGDLINTADVSANPTLADGSDIVGLDNQIDENTAEVRELYTGIEVEKTVYGGHTAGANCAGDEYVDGPAGKLITYCFEVINNGNTHLDEIVVNDTTLGLTRADLTLLSGSEPLAPSASLIYYYETTLDADLVNTVTTSANPTLEDGTDVPNLENPTDDDTAEVKLLFTGIALEKTVYNEHSGGADCGGWELLRAAQDGRITYCFEVTNLGNTHLANIVIEDTTLGIDTSALTLLTGALPLPPGESLMYYYQTTATEDLVNTATVTGTPADADGNPNFELDAPTDTNTAEVTLLLPAIELQKTVYFGHSNGTACQGDELVTAFNATPVTYCFMVSNTGNTYLNDITLTDDDLGLVHSDFTLRTGTTPLAPGASLIYYVESTIDGDLLNTANVVANPSEADGGDLAILEDVSDEDTAEVDEIIDPQPAIEIIKTAGDAADDESFIIQEAAEVQYTYVITNTGNVTLFDVTFTDDAGTGADTSDDVTVDGSTCLEIAGPLDAGERVTCTLTLNVSDTVTNIADVTGTPIDEDGNVYTDVTPPMDSDDAEVQLVPPLVPSVKIVKTAGTANDGDSYVITVPSDVLYTYVIANDGETYLTDITITDDAGTPDDTADDVTINAEQCAELAGPLAPNASVTCSVVLNIAATTTNIADVIGTPTDADGTVLPDLPQPTDADNALVDLQLDDSAAIGSTVWLDTNYDGVQNDDEVGVENVTVNLYDDENNLIATTTTDADGGYLFDNLIPGQYYVEFDLNTLPDGAAPTLQNAGSDDTTDSDADPTSGRTILTTLESNERDLDWNMGVFQRGSIGDTVWFDIDGDGTQEDGENGIAGVGINLLDGNGTIVASMTTDENGRYLFTDLIPGNYQVEFTTPQGFGFTLPFEGSDRTVDSDANRSDGRSGLIQLESGETVTDIDAGLASGSVLSAIEEEMARREQQTTPTEIPTSTATVPPTVAPTATPNPTQSPATATPVPAQPTAVPVQPTAVPAQPTPVPTSAAVKQPLNTDTLGANSATSLSAPIINKTVNQSIGEVGDTLTYTVTIVNPNSTTVSGATMTDTLSPMLDYVSATSSKGSATYNPSNRIVTVLMGDLAAGETVAVTINARINANAVAPASITNVAQIAASQTNINSSNIVSTQIIPRQIPTTGMFGNTTGAYAVYAIILGLLLANIMTAVSQHNALKRRYHG